jgi:hypothetical protein
MTDCNICYFSIEGISIKCSGENCECLICHDCFISFMDHLEKENGIPICPFNNCRGEIMYSEILMKNNKNLTLKFQNIIYNYLKHNNLDNITADKNHKLMLVKIRKDRHQFIMKTFPSAINKIIQIGLQTKLNKINKKNRELIKKVSTVDIKKCSNIFCYMGVLDINNICLTCSTEFCSKCEHKLNENEQHICKEEDINTLKFVETLVKCPKCKLPAVKSYGCNNITCAVCKTNFDYITGKLSEYGNHDNVTVSLTNYDKLTNVLKNDEKYKDNSEFLIILKRIENLQPQSYSFTNVINILQKYIDNEKDINLHLLISKYEKYKLSQIENKKYFKYIIKLQEYYEKKELDFSKLKEIYNYLISE